MILPRKLSGFLADNVLRRLPTRGGPRRIPPARHHIQPDQIHPTIRTIVDTLEKNGYTAWIVGGAVRDLLLGRIPKDFDLATDAKPEEVKDCFRNAKIIGRRFRLVHLEYPDMTVEVATFRAKPRGNNGQMVQRDNTYGSPEEDAFRRDFTVNALAFDVGTFSIIDFVGGLDDLEHKTLRTITNPRESIGEDPVRMLRAVRFVERLEFSLDPDLEKATRTLGKNLLQAKRHRLAEETQRFLTRGSAQACMDHLEDLGLLVPMLGTGHFRWVWNEQSAINPLPALSPMLTVLDRWHAQGREPVQPAIVLLTVVMALARRDLRGLFLGEKNAQRRRGATYIQETTYRLHRMLGDWGLLKGQVEPAMEALEAARTVRAAAEAQFHNAGQRGPHQSKQKSKSAHTPLGAREGWQILLMLQEVTNLSPEVIKAGEAALDELPRMDIPDHPKPPPRTARRGPPQRKRNRGPLGSGGSGHRSAIRTGDNTGNTAASKPATTDSDRPPRRRRPRRRKPASI